MNVGLKFLERLTGYVKLEFEQLVASIATGWAVEHNLDGTHKALSDVRRFGVLGNGTHDDTAGLQEAVDVTVDAGGGKVFLPPGTYRTTATIDFTSRQSRSAIGGKVWLCGANAGATIIKPEQDGACFIGANILSVFNRISDLWVLGPYNGSTHVAGNYGVTTNGSTGSGLILDSLAFSQLGDSAIQIAGPTGPTLVRDTHIVSCAGYGIELLTYGGVQPQDVTIEGGSIQSCFGGILADSASSLHISDTDIELLSAATFPAVHLVGPCYGCSLTDVTAAINSGTVTPNAVIALASNGTAGPYGTVITGGINLTGVATMDNVLIDGTGTEHNTIIGGIYSGAGTGASGYPVNASNSVNTAVIHPALAFTYETAKRCVKDDGTLWGNKITANGIDVLTRHVLATGAGRTADDVITALQNLGLVQQS